MSTDKSNSPESQIDARQAEIIRANTETVKRINEHLVANESPLDHVADAITAFAGSNWFVVIHTVWFGIWILMGSGFIRVGGLDKLDPYPFSFLTLVVSLEAIFLSTFVLIAQNKLAESADRRSELDLQINLLAEQKAAKTLELLQRIVEQMNAMANEFKVAVDDEADALQQSPQPADIIHIIETAAGKVKAEK